jgi:hypothetical protein
VLTDKGLRVDPKKINAMKLLEHPKDCAGMLRFIGFVNFLARFLPRLSDVLEALRKLMNSYSEKFEWKAVHEKAFETAKQLATESPVLAYYDPKLELTIQCDASEKGLGSTLLHEGRPLCYASRALIDTETN